MSYYIINTSPVLSSLHNPNYNHSNPQKDAEKVCHQDGSSIILPILYIYFMFPGFQGMFYLYWRLLYVSICEICWSIPYVYWFNPHRFVSHWIILNPFRSSIFRAYSSIISQWNGRKRDRFWTSPYLDSGTCRCLQRASGKSSPPCGAAGFPKRLIPKWPILWRNVPEFNKLNGGLYIYI